MGELDIAQLCERVAADRRTLTEPEVKDWCGRRWRNLFINEAARDPDAVKSAARHLGLPGTDIKLRAGGDKRPPEQRIAERFLRGAEDEWKQELPPPERKPIENTTLVFCPGLIGTMLPLRAFDTVFPKLEQERGIRVLVADAHPMRGCAANIDDLVAALEHGRGTTPAGAPIPPEAQEPPKDVILLGYSKGTPDALSLLAQHPELAPRVRALVCWGGAVRGSPLADNIYAQVKDLELPLGGIGDALAALVKTVFPIVNLDGVSERLDEYDVRGALRALTTTEREAFLEQHADAIDALDVPIFNITGSTSALEVPYFQVQGYLELARLDQDNDMQLTQDQARMSTPMATDLAVLHAHHWDISYGPFPPQTRLGAANLDHPFPRQAALTALVDLFAELGLID